MNFKKQIQNEITEQSGKLVKAVSFQMIPVIVIAGQLFVFWFSGKENLFPDSDALMTVISCCAQIIAGLYGITLGWQQSIMPRSMPMKQWCSHSRAELK